MQLRKRDAAKARAPACEPHDAAICWTSLTSWPCFAPRAVGATLTRGGCNSVPSQEQVTVDDSGPARSARDGLGNDFDKTSHLSKGTYRLSIAVDTIFD